MKNLGTYTRYLSFIFCLSTSQIFAQTTFSSSGTWICPSGVTSVQVEAWGGGGAGGNGGSSNKQAGGGGGGGSYSKNTSVTVIPGTSYTITIGAGGTPSITVGQNGNPGGTTTATFGETTVSANGGAGGIGHTGGGTGGSGGTGSSYNGGNGGTGNSSTGNGGGGGEGAGTSSDGGNASGGTGGSGTDGGNGATDATSDNFHAGTSATATGGGGSGSVKNYSAGAGYKGKMTITCAGCYCLAPHTVSCTAYINNVIFNSSLNNSSSGCTSVDGTAYTKYEGTGGNTTSVTKDSTYTISITHAGATGKSSVWIDFDHNGSFDASEWVEVAPASSTSGTYTKNITISSSATAGATGMRVRFRSAASGNESGDACTSFGSGETEDYVITICENTARTSSSSSYSIACDETVDLSLSAGDGDLTIWQESSSGEPDSFTDIAGATNSPYTTNTVGNNTYYRAKITDGSCIVFTASIYVEVVPSSGTASTSNPTTICYNTTKVLSLTGYSGTIQWEESDDNGVSDAWANVIGGSGSTTDSYTTASLTSTKYFRARITGAGCSDVYSNTLTISVGASGAAIWNGGTSAWETADNWCGSVPISTTNVVIPSSVSNSPTIGGSIAAVCLDLTINSGATLTVSSSNTALVIAGNLTNNGTINHTGSSSATSASTAYWIQMNGANKTLGGTGNFSNMALLFNTTGSSTTLTSNVSLSKFFLSAVGTNPILNLSSYTFAPATMFVQYGQLNVNSGTLEYSGTASTSTSTWTSTTGTFNSGTGTVYLNNSGSWNTYPALAYYNLKMKTNSGQEHHGPGTETISNNFELVAGTSGGKLHHHSTTLTVGGNVTIGTGSELNLAYTANASNITVTGNVDISGTITCNTSSALTTSGNITINSGGTLTSSTSTVISVGGNWVNDGTFTKSTGRVTFTGASNKTISGSTSTSFYNITVDKGSDTTSYIEATGAMSMTGHLTLSNGVMKLTHASSSAQFTVSSTTVPVTAGICINGGTFTNSASLNYINNGLFRIISGTATIASVIGYRFENGSTGFFHMTGGTCINGWRFLSNDGKFTMTDGTFTLNTLASAGSTNATFEATSASSFIMTGGTIIIQDENTSTGDDLKITTGGTKSITGGTFQIGNASTPASTVFIINCSQPIYNLTINSTNNPKARLESNALAVTNDITISGGILDAATNALNLSVGGNWINNSSATSNGHIGYDAATEKVTFNGGAAQTISGSGITTFHDLEIANTANNVALSVDATVNGTLTMTSGDLVIATTKKLSIDDTDDPGISGGSASSMIVTSGTATVQKTYTFTTPITFPLGDGTNYRPLSLTPAGIGSTIWTVAYSPTIYENTTSDGSFDHVCVSEYWICDRDVAGSPENATMALTWDANSAVDDYTQLTIVHFDGTTDWDKITSTPVGANEAGTITSDAAITSFSPFTIGSFTSANPLPINLISFNAITKGNIVEFTWITLSELNNDYFTIERSVDGVNFEFVTTVDGAGNSNQLLNYMAIDQFPYKGISYYRLKQTDYDGKFEYFNIVSVTIASETKSFDLTLYPNPLPNSSTLKVKLEGEKNQEVLLVISDLLGKEYYSKVIVLEEAEQVVAVDPYENLSPGIYMVTGSSKNSLYSKKLVVK